MDKLRCTDIHAAGRLVGDHDLRLARHLARDNDLLHVAAGEHTQQLFAGRAFDLEILYKLLGERPDLAG